MTTLPRELYRAEHVRELDRIAIEVVGTPGIVLMERAGKAAFDALRWRWPRVRHIGVLCGVGNNGGDGFVVARLAAEAGVAVRILMLGDTRRLKGDALLAFNKLPSTVSVQPFDKSIGEVFDVIVDAMLGTGLKGPVEGQWRVAIGWVHQAKRQIGSQVMSLDIPSGLQADTGCVTGAAVPADLTITFIGVKQGLMTASGPDYCGELGFNDLQVDPAIYQHVSASATLLTGDTLQDVFSPRVKNAHKRNYGHVLVIGGNWGMPGAVQLAANAALRTGAGMVSVATRFEHIAGIVSACPELMCHGIGSAVDVQKLLPSATCVAIGPGLGQDDWARGLLREVLQCGLPLVVDADALNLLANEPIYRQNWVLTPHPGEAGRLLGLTTAQVQADRFSAVRQLQANYGGVVVLKGCGTLVASPSGYGGAQDQQGNVAPGLATIRLCQAGNPGMASAGMGDVLTGVVSATIAQHMAWQTVHTEVGTLNPTAQPAGQPSIKEKVALDVAAWAAVYLHSLAGDMAAEQGERGLLASDLFPFIHQLVNSANE